MLAYLCLTSETTELHLLLLSPPERYLSRVYEKDPSDHWAKSRLAAHNAGMITQSDEKTQEDDTGVMGWKSACRGAKHIS